MDKENVTADKPTPPVKLMKYSIDSILGKHEKRVQSEEFLQIKETAQISVPRCKYFVRSVRNSVVNGVW